MDGTKKFSGKVFRNPNVTFEFVSKDTKPHEVTIGEIKRVYPRKHNNNQDE